MTPGQKAMVKTVDHRGDVCEFCGRKAKPKPGYGKLRYAHQCPHGEPCARGVRLVGNHANWPTCQGCIPYRRAYLAGTTV